MRNTRKLPLEALAPYQLDVPLPRSRTSEASFLQPIDWHLLFGNQHPVEIEVGFGKGLFLLNAGLSRPDINFFGIEIVRKYQLYATQRIALRKLQNVKTCCSDAKRVLRELVPAESVAAVHVFFPDPWWKKRHKKRLLFTAEFAADVLRVLQPGGHLHFVSDVADYFAMVTEMLAGLPFHRMPPPDSAEPAHDMDYLTNFERKFRKEGRPIYRALYVK